MNTQETIDFYDKESKAYSLKRYAKVATSYYQYLFMRRLEIFLAFLKDIEPSLPTHATLLEVGCADGILMKAIEEKFPGRFASMTGVDIASKMIEEAKRTNTNPRASFCMRSELSVQTFDIVIELGVRVPDIGKELDDANSRLSQGGYFFYCLAGKNSSHIFFKMKADEVEDFQTYKGFDRLVTTRFIIASSQVYAFFVPKLWAIPVLGRGLQPIFDLVFQKIIPESFHEKIYLLKKKS